MREDHGDRGPRGPSSGHAATVKTLWLLRHAKSSWEDLTLVDADRPLAPRGHRAARRMARYLADEGLRPAVLCSSGAERALATARALRAAWPDAPALDVEASLYEAEPEALLRCIGSTPDAADSLLLVGHQPGLQDLALHLIGRGQRKLRQRLARKWPTAALVELAFDVSGWRQIESRTGELVRFVRPSDLA